MNLIFPIFLFLFSFIFSFFSLWLKIEILEIFSRVDDFSDILAVFFSWPFLKFFFVFSKGGGEGGRGWIISRSPQILPTVIFGIGDSFLREIQVPIPSTDSQ